MEQRAHLGPASDAPAAPVGWLAYVPRRIALGVLDHPDRSPIAREDRLTAATMFADISGFTPLAEALADSGKRGPEELTDLLNDFFGLLVSLVGDWGGDVVGFGGDAVTAFFPAGRTVRSACRRAIRCALEMQALMPRFSAVTTSVGESSLRFKAGIGVGEVLVTTVGVPEERLEPVVAGDAIDRSVAAEHVASAGQVVVHPSALAEVADSDVHTGEEHGGFRRAISAPAARRPRRRVAPRPPNDRDALRAFVHPVVAERIRAGHGRLLSEHRRLTTLFMEFDGIEASEPGSAARLQDYLRPLFESVITREGHVKQVEIGDKGSKIVAIFGAPVAHHDDEERAIRCALELVRRGSERRARVGMSAGSVFCAEIGGAGRRSYTAIGDAINVAARLMQAADGGTILATGLTQRHLHAASTPMPSTPIAVKGRHAAVPVVEIRPPRQDEPSFRPVPTMRSPLVGRRAEIGALERVLRGASGGRGRLVAITGPPGIGKTRLAELARERADALGFDVHEAPCGPEGERIPYLPWRRLLASLLGLGLAEGVDATELVRRRVRELDPALEPRAAVLSAPLKVAITDSPATAGLDPGIRSELLVDLVTRIVTLRSETRPVLLVVEDVQWVDAPSAELLAAVARHAARHAIGLVVTARPTAPDRDPLAWAERTGAMQEIALEGLPDSDLEQIARDSSRRVFEGPDLPPPVIHALVDRADGNPFFLEEAIHLLNERGLDPRSASQISELPDSLSSLALARLDALHPDDHALVKLASVLGRRFDAGWASGSFPELGSPAAVQQRLDGLRAPDIVRRVGTNEYTFTHGVIRDAAYATLALSLREELHERVGRYVELSFGDEIDRHVDDLAYHYGESRNIAKHREYFRLAADAARAAYSNESALGWLERLLAVSTPEGKSDVLRDLGELRQLLGEWEAADEIFSRALAAAEEAGDRRAGARCRASIGRLRTYTASFDEAHRWLEEARSAFESENDAPGLLRTLEYLAFAAWQSSAYEESMDYSLRHLDVAQRLGDRPAACMAIEQMGLVHWHRGEYDEARAEFERALDQADRSGFVWAVIHSSNDLAGLFSEQGDHLRAFQSVRRGVESAEEIGYRHALGVMIGNAGELYRIHGQVETAIECACAGLAITAELPDWPDVVAKVGNIALALRDSDQLERAGTFFETAIALARATDDPSQLCEYLHGHAGMLAVEGSVEAARAANDEALALASRIDRRDVRFGAELLSIDLAVAGGDLESAIASKQLEDLVAVAATDGERADVDHAAWRLTSDPQARRRAAELSRRRHDRVPRADDRRRYLELTGEELEPPAPLPPLPGADEWDPPSLDSVLAHARELLVRIAEERSSDPSATLSSA